MYMAYFPTRLSSGMTLKVWENAEFEDPDCLENVWHVFRRTGILRCGLLRQGCDVEFEGQNRNLVLQVGRQSSHYLR